MNPKRRRRRGRRHTRRRHHRRNPPRIGGGILGDLKAVTPAVGYGLVGVVGTNILPGTLRRFIPIPSKAESPAMYYGAKLLTAVGLGWLVGRFASRHAGRLVLTGGVLSLASEAAQDYVIGPMGLSTYIDGGMGADEDMGTYLPDGSPLGYLSPGVTVGDMDDDETLVTRLDPNRRL